jgi:hypothetical protein
MVMNVCIWESTTLQHCGVRVYPAIYNRNVGTFASSPRAFARGKVAVDSMIVSDHLDIVSCVLGIMFVMSFLNFYIRTQSAIIHSCCTCSTCPWVNSRGLLLHIMPFFHAIISMYPDIIPHYTT